jgi:tetratricopeptide (TPR) repeat protein
MGLFDRFKSTTATTKKASAGATTKKASAGATTKKASAEAWYRKAEEIPLMSARDQEALQCYDKALEIDPQYTRAWIGKASVLVVHCSFQEALRCCDKAIKVAPKGEHPQELMQYAQKLKQMTLEEMGRH